MITQKLKIGDRVKSTALLDRNGLPKDMIGVVVGFGEDRNLVCVSWKNWDSGHAGNGYRKVPMPKGHSEGSCWNVNIAYLEFVQTQFEFNFNA